MVDLEGTLRASIGGQYDIEEEVGRGGMSVVFRAHDHKHNRTVAIKVLRPELSEQIGAERFQREIEVVAGITHPHILTLHDSGEADGLLYYVMPFVEDGSLRARMENEGALPEADAIRIVGEIADALGYAHRHGVIHRDVKPGNILLAGNHALLADFGIAHLASGVQETLTLAGLALGTPAYLSPEQASGEHEIDGRSDIYSLGCVLYEALSGSPPFSGDSIRAMLVHQMVDTPVPVRTLNEGVSQIAETIVETAIRKEPSERFQTAEQMARALELASGSRYGGIPTRVLRRLGVPRRHVDRARMAMAAAAAAVAVLMLFAVWNRDRGAGDSPLRPEVRYVVLEHERADATEWERTLSIHATRELREQLDGWTTVSVVQEPAMQGSIAELRVAGLSQSVFSVAAGLAERYRADFIVYVDATELGGLTGSAVDSAQSRVLIQASLLDPATGDDLGFSRSGSVDSLRVVTAGIALEMLKLEGEPEDYPTLLGRSQDHLAQQEFQAGRDALWAWRLAEAHRLFEAAIARDSAFALARHLLAQTMYWEMSREEERLRELGPQIDYHSRTADRVGTSERLRPGERNAVNAFRAFWTGDYELARNRYDSLIEYDPYDLESLVLRGAVEVEDPMLQERDDGTLLPRRNLNVARTVFDTATVLNPKWELSWGHLHRIDREVAETAYSGMGCFGFESPGEVLVTPYQIREAAEQEYYCPVMAADTIAWKPSERFTLPADSAAAAAAAALHRRTVELLDNSTRVELDQPRHHEELADFLLWEQYLPRCNADPVRTDSLRKRARWHFERALQMRGDTTPQNRVTLGSLYLGSGNLESAVAATERALDELEGWETPEGTAPPLAAANSFLAAGRAHPTVDILERVWDENTMAVMDPQDTTRSINTFRTYGTLNALLALGTLGVSGPDVANRLDRLERTWREAPLSDRDRAKLRLALLPMYVGPALVHSPEYWGEWFAGWDRYGLEIPTIWRGIFAAEESPPDLVEARARLEEALRELDAGFAYGPATPSDLYLPLVLAEKIGAASVEAELRDRLDRCALRLDNFDPGWAMRSSLGLMD